MVHKFGVFFQLRHASSWNDTIYEQYLIHLFDIYILFGSFKAFMATVLVCGDDITTVDVSRWHYSQCQSLADLIMSVIEVSMNNTAIIYALLILYVYKLVKCISEYYCNVRICSKVWK